MDLKQTFKPGLQADEGPEGRLLLLEYLRKELIGPVNGKEEEIEGEPPHKRYTMGILFPVDASTDKELENEEDDSGGSSGYDDLLDDPVTLAGQWMPSSMGLSFFFIGEPEIEVFVYASRYVKLKDGKAGWLRKPLAEENKPERVIISPKKDGLGEEPVLSGSAKLVGHWRRLGDGYLVTVTLVNSVSRSTKEVNGEDCLCQTGFKCRPVSGRIQEYPSVKINTSDPEEQELQLLYRDKKVFAVGHGCSAEWDVAKTIPDLIKTQVLPTAYVPALTHDLEESPEILQIARLADSGSSKTIILEKLSSFVDLYEQWINRLEPENIDIPQRLLPAKKRILERLHIANERMRCGIEVLETNSLAWKAFQMANLAMLMQMRHASKELAGTRKKRNQADTTEQNYLSLRYNWRPFQLAFQLLAIESVVNENSSFREVVDLIWFPTGGGKTEAYLALSAFEIFHRRLKYRDQGAGTVVITRYTLRLLTSQQFQRAARLITACEYLRRKDPKLLGNSPITIGFWAGGETSPNDYNKACDCHNEIFESPYPSAYNKFQIDCCPWCGTELLPVKGTEDSADYGFKCTNSSFQVYCPSDRCVFHNSIPVSVVDDDLYKNPPTFLIATVDKFARMTWVEGAGSFFGNGKYLPPSLIIQDELHLLSGPLGTTVGLYESAFEGLMSLHGAKPKIVASTATIRSAGSQIKSLFARDVLLFPSPGLCSDDSFFARTDKSKKGRLYVGAMSSNHRATTSVVRTAAALLQGVEEAEGLTDAEKDAYWTLVIYHLSLRELGKTVSFSRDDIPARMKLIARTEDSVREIYDEDVLELTSNLSASDIPESLKKMERNYNHDDSVSIVACTNMFSVGVDVPRLGLMMVNGQPKTTSEYIQASSRVGRGDVPGIVITHYSASKPRDRSHYESFLPYHTSIYRFVEPVSVTPFSLPARNRALHAALVILIRHGAGLSLNTDAIKFNSADIKVQKAVQILLAQARLKDPQEAANSAVHIQRLLNHWEKMVNEAKSSGYPLCYSGRTRQVRSLLINFGDKGEGWPTLHSMRSVDPQCSITVNGE